MASGSVVMSNVGGGASSADGGMSTERELLYKILFDMRSDINDLKRMMLEMMHSGVGGGVPASTQSAQHDASSSIVGLLPSSPPQEEDYAESEVVVDEVPREYTKADMQREQIIKALRRNGGKRREAAAELFMSERTLYRKIKELGIEERD